MAHQKYQGHSGHYPTPTDWMPVDQANGVEVRFKWIKRA
jgi:hypothetical protein